MGFDSSSAEDICCSGPSFDNNLMISLQGTPLRSHGSLETDSWLTALALGMIQVASEGTARAHIPWLGRPPGSSWRPEEGSSPFAGLSKMVDQKLDLLAAIFASTWEELA